MMRQHDYPKQKCLGQDGKSVRSDDEKENAGR
jgi:hypothetical protein